MDREGVAFRLAPRKDVSMDTAERRAGGIYAKKNIQRNYPEHV
jgi:hypothetical protein